MRAFRDTCLTRWWISFVLAALSACTAPELFETKLIGAVPLPAPMNPQAIYDLKPALAPSKLDAAASLTDVPRAIAVLTVDTTGLTHGTGLFDV